jgi:hypothetical protein
MAALYHVNGTCRMYVGQGTGGSLIGLSGVEGVRISIASGNTEQFSDEYGPFMPAEILNLGQRAIITFELWQWDQTVWNNLLILRNGGSGSGGIQTIGQLMLSAGKFFGLTLSSPLDGVPWYFPTCMIAADPVEVNLSTTMKIWRAQIAAYSWSSSGPASAYLYTNSIG